MERKNPGLQLKDHCGDAAVEAEEGKVEKANFESERSEQRPDASNSTQFDNSKPSASWMPQRGQIRSCGRNFFLASVTSAVILFVLHAIVFGSCSVDDPKAAFIVADLVWTFALWVAIAFVLALTDHGGRFRRESRIHRWIKRWAQLQAAVLAILRIYSVGFECFYDYGSDYGGRQVVQDRSMYLSMIYCISPFTLFYVMLLRLRLVNTFVPVSLWVGERSFTMTWCGWIIVVLWLVVDIGVPKFTSDFDNTDRYFDKNSFLGYVSWILGCIPIAGSCIFLFSNLIALCQTAIYARETALRGENMSAEVAEEVIKACRWTNWTALAVVLALMSMCLQFIIGYTPNVQWSLLGPATDSIFNTVLMGMLSGIWFSEDEQLPEDHLQIAARAATGSVLTVDVAKQLGESGISREDVDTWSGNFTGYVGAAPELAQDVPYNPPMDSSHLLLGLSHLAIFQILERIRFITARSSSRPANLSRQNTRRAPPDEAGDGDHCYSAHYQRPEGLSSWLDELVGTICDGGKHGRQNIVGYDVCFYIRDWLLSNQFSDRSLVEVALTDPTWANLKGGVSLANIFWSHLQSELLLGTTLKAMKDYLSFHKDRNLVFWLDYFCLRQVQNDFHIYTVIECIHKIGALAACIDHELTYVGRSFCLLESFAAIIGGCQFECIAYIGRRDFAAKRIESKSANTRKETEKQAIDNLISQTIGFERLDTLLSHSISAGLVEDGA